MAEKRDLYAVLGVARDADENAIRKAYRQLARRFHPDVNPGDQEAEERFKEVSQAYSVLSDPEKRALYDEFGEVSLEGGFDAEAARRARSAFAGRFGGGEPNIHFEFGGPAGEGFGFGSLDDLFSELFARQGGKAGPMPRGGPDLESVLELDFLDAARGGEQRLTIARPTAEGGTRTETVTVRFPPGVADGGRIRVPGKGGEGSQGAPAGDLQLRIRVRPHRYFRREGRDLYLDVPVSVREAVLGAKVEIPTLGGRITLTVPPGTDGGTKLRVREKGVPHPSGGAPGDLYAVVQIKVPDTIDAESARKLEEIPELRGDDLPRDW